MTKTSRRILATALIAIQALVPTYASSADTTYFFRYVSGLDKPSVTDPGEDESGTDVAGSIPDVTLASLAGNVAGTTISSANPSQALAAIRRNLVGGESAVVFETAYPSIPGLSFNPATGTVSGTAQAEFNGTITITYHDAAARRGKISVPVSIYPHPVLVSEQDSYDLPQNASAVAYDIHVAPGNDGFYNGVTYSLAPDSQPLPAGLTVTNGVILGTTTTMPGSYTVTLRGSSPTDAAIHADKTITLNVVAPAPMSLDLKPDTPLVWQFDETTGKIVAQDVFKPVPTPKGTYVSPIEWSLIDAPAWMTIGSDGQLQGTPPARGTYTARVVVKDAQQAVAYDDVSVKVVKDGYIFLSPGIQHIAARVNETFATKAQTVSNAVGTYQFTSEIRPSNVAVDPATGVSTGNFANPGGYFWRLRVKDEEGRTDAHGKIGGTNYIQLVDILPPVELAAALSATGGIQGSAEAPLSIKWGAPRNLIGKAEYSILGAVPGTLYYKEYDGDDPTKLATYVKARGDDSGTEIRQRATETTAETEARLASDHIVFDPVALTLTGTASQAGYFDIALHVQDDHEQTGYTVNPSDTGRTTANSATSPYANVSVSGHSFVAVNFGGTDQQLAQFTSPTTLTTALRDSVSNVAYVPDQATWTLASGTLPPGITTSVSPNTAVLSYSGYPTEQGTWSNITWQVTDKQGNQGNQITTPPVSFTVGPRGELSLTADPSATREVSVGADATIAVKAANLPNGQQLAAGDWKVTGALPEGVTWAAGNSEIVFSGAPLVAGTYDVAVSITDSLGAPASIALKFKVSSGLSVINFGGGNQTLSQFTTQPTLESAVRITVSNEPYQVGDLTWALVSGTLPPGITTQISADTSVLKYVGYPTEQGTWSNIVWSATNADGNRVFTPAANFTVGPRTEVALTADPTTTVHVDNGGDVALTVRAANTAHGQTLATGDWTVTGDLPPGVTYHSNGNTLVFSGTADEAGLYHVTVAATDALGSIGTVNLTFDVSVSFFATNLYGSDQTLAQYTAQPTVGTSIRDRNTNESYSGTLTWTLVSGTLPPGITTEVSAGTDSISYVGYPTEQGTWSNIKWAVKDTNGNGITTPAVSLTVGPRDALALTADNGGVANIENGETLSMAVTATNASFGTLDASNWNVSGTLPAGVTYAVQNKVLTFSGSMKKTGRYDVVVSATDGASGTASTTVTFNVSSFMNSFNIGGSDQVLTQNTSLPTVSTWARIRKSNEAYYNGTWALVSGTLPPGITSSVVADSSRIAYLGYPTEQGTWSNIVWSITDPDGNFILTDPVSFTVGPRADLALATNPANGTYATRTGLAIGAGALTVTASNLPYGAALTPSNWMVTGLPDGVSYAVNGNVLSFTGTPTIAGEYTITVKATDSLNGTTTKTIAFKVGVNLSALYFAGTSQTLMQYVDQPTMWANIRVAASNEAYHGGATYSLASGTLPAGVTVGGAADGAYANFTGYPTEVGTFDNLVIAVTDPYGNVFNTKPFSMTVTPRAALALTAMPGTTRTMQQNTDDAQLTVSPANLAFGTPIPTSDWTVTGSLPPGVSYAATPAGLVFSGKGTTAGTYNVHVVGVDSTASSASVDLTFKVTAIAPSYSVTNYSTGSVVANTQSVMFGSAPTLTTQAKLKSNSTLYTGITSWALASGKLPPGVTAVVSADKSTISYSGAPSEMGTYGNIVWMATDATGAQVASAPITFIVNGPITQLSASWYSTCGVTSDGAAKCWGRNDNGGAGDGTLVDKLIPTQVLTLTSGVQQISTGKNHACAVIADGTIKCWGYNDRGQLGQGVSNTRKVSTPETATNFGSNNKMVATGDSTTCALKNSGSVLCVGANGFGQLGNNATATTQATAVTPVGLTSGVAKIVTGINTTCAIMADGTAKCWGKNNFGQIGDGTNVDKLVPTTVPGLTGVNNIASHGYLTSYGTTCASTSSGIKCWGMGIYGQIGDGVKTNRNLPASVTGMETAIDVQVGVTHVCGHKSDKTIWCWGGGANGRSGDGLTTDKATITVPVINLSPVETFAGGGDHTCATNAAGLTKCWGAGANGALGVGSTTDQTTAQPISY